MGSCWVLEQGCIRKVNDAVGIDIVGYNIQQATDLSITPDLLRRLSELNFHLGQRWRLHHPIGISAN